MHELIWTPEKTKLLIGVKPRGTARDYEADDAAEDKTSWDDKDLAENLVALAPGVAREVCESVAASRINT